MKAITLPQPAATLVALGKKQVLTFAWGTRYRGRLAIHAGARGDSGHPLQPKESELLDWLNDPALRFSLLRAFRCDDSVRELLTVLRNLPRNAIVAECEIGDVVRSYGPGPSTHISPIEAAFGDFSAGQILWFLHKIKPLEPAVPAEGKSSGLWEWTPVHSRQEQ